MRMFIVSMFNAQCSMFNVYWQILRTTLAFDRAGLSTSIQELKTPNIEHCTLHIEHFWDAFAHLRTV